jgi:hypothetical protein
MVQQPTDLTDAATIAQNDFGFGVGDFTDAANALSGGDYVDAASSASFGINDAFILPLEELLLGATASL